MNQHRLPAGRRLPFLLPVAVALALAGCSGVRETLPARSATEELLISKAADRAAEAVAQYVPPDRTIYLDAANFEGPDGKYAVAAIRDSILRRGTRVAGERDKADMVVEVRSGALSVDKTDTLVGLPSFKLPIPLAQAAETPEVALYKNVTSQGVAKFAATAWDAKTGALVVASGPQFGFAHHTDQTLLLFISWTSNDYKPAEETPQEMLGLD